MADLNLAQDFIDKSRELHSFTELDGLMYDITRELGFSYFALVQNISHSPESDEAVQLHSYPEGWAVEFGSLRRLADDPIILASCKTGVGFAWENVDQIISLTSRQKQILETARSKGIGDGFTVPAHLPGEATGSCNFAQPIGKDIPQPSLPAAQLVGSFAFQSARDIMNKSLRKIPVDPVELTPRQLDCIVLVAQGKTDWEIAQILGIGEETVAFHLTEARKRYNVVKRVQLVTNALGDGHLTLADVLIQRPLFSCR